MTAIALDAELIDADETTVLTRYPHTLQSVTELAESFKGLTIRDLNDKEGFQRVHAARVTLRDARIAIEKKRKDLKSDSLRVGKLIDSAAKLLTAPLLPVEEALQKQEDAINAERERLKKEKLQNRVDRLKAVDADSPIVLLETMDDASFEMLLAQKTDQFNAKKAEEARLQAEREAEEKRLNERFAARKARLEELCVPLQEIFAHGLTEEDFESHIARQLDLKEQARLAAEREKELQAERERLAEVERQRREEQERIEAARRKALEEEEARAAAERARLKAEQDKIDAERRAIEEEKRRQEEARLARERAEREAAEAQARAEEAAEQAAREQARLEALKPDREKLLAVVDWLSEACVPEVSNDPNALRARERIQTSLESTAATVRLIINEELN